MKRLVILRGLPGSGKSTYIRQHLNGPDVVVCSADDFFISEEGEYIFDPSQLPMAHGKCQEKALLAMDGCAHHIVIDNTNTTHGEFYLYRVVAKLYGYTVEVHDLFDAGLTDAELAARNRHGVPEIAIAAMRGRWEE